MAMDLREMSFQNVLDQILQPAGVKVGGFSDEMFLDMSDEEKEKYSCNICFLIAKDCRQCDNKHLFCHTCVFAWSMTYGENSQRCPMCRSDQKEYLPNKEVDSEVANKRVKCPEPGCPFRAPVKIYLMHSHGKQLHSNAHVDLESLRPPRANNARLLVLPLLSAMAETQEVEPGPGGRQHRAAAIRGQLHQGRMMIHQMMLLLHLEMQLRQQALVSYQEAQDPTVRLQRLDEVLALNEQLNEVGTILSGLLNTPLQSVSGAAAGAAGTAMAAGLAGVRRAVGGGGGGGGEAPTPVTLSAQLTQASSTTAAQSLPGPRPSGVIRTSLSVQQRGHEDSDSEDSDSSSSSSSDSSIVSRMRRDFASSRRIDTVPVLSQGAVTSSAAASSSVTPVSPVTQTLRQTTSDALLRVRRASQTANPESGSGSGSGSGSLAAPQRTTLLSRRPDPSPVGLTPVTPRATPSASGQVSVQRLGSESTTPSPRSSLSLPPLSTTPRGRTPGRPDLLPSRPTHAPSQPRPNPAPHRQHPENDDEEEASTPSSMPTGSLNLRRAMASLGPRPSPLQPISAPDSDAATGRGEPARHGPREPSTISITAYPEPLSPEPSNAIIPSHMYRRVARPAAAADSRTAARRVRSSTRPIQPPASTSTSPTRRLPRTQAAPRITARPAASTSSRTAPRSTAAKPGAAAAKPPAHSSSTASHPSTRRNSRTTTAQPATNAPAGANGLPTMPGGMLRPRRKSEIRHENLFPKRGAGDEN